MATFMIKVAGEGLIAKAHRSADPGPTSGYSTIYEVQNVPDSATVEDVIEAMKKVNGKPEHTDYEVDWASLSA